MEKIYLKNEFDKFWEKIENKENFSLLRYADGERAVMTGKSIKTIDNWVSPEGVSKLGRSLLDGLELDGDNLYYGISCPDCDIESYYWIRSRIKSKNITFSNLFVNVNYNRFLELFKKLKRDAIVISNNNAEGKKFGNLNILKYYCPWSFNEDCFAFWENEASKMLKQIKQEFGDKNDILYIISAGPMSEPIIAELYKNNPNNTYIDFGCAVSEFIHESQNRPFINKNHPSASQNCWMHDPKTTDFDISVVLTLYKRPENLEKQLLAIENQTLKPKEILLFQDGTEGYYEIELSEKFKKRFNLISLNKKNFGVWERFRFTQQAKSKYICVFDDDTIPGDRWLENCHSNMIEQEGLYGTIGIVLLEPDNYPRNGFFRAGWDAPVEKSVEVDFVGHSWFFKKDWIECLFEGTEDFQKFKTAAEDMCFSAQLKKHGIKTFVPPHPVLNKQLYGSLPDNAGRLGSSAVALWLTPGNFNAMGVALKLLIEKGWKPLVYSDVEELKKTHKEVIISQTVMKTLAERAKAHS